VGFSPSFLDELRLRSPLVDVISKRVKLIRRGREYTGLCPFHNEKSPSFTVSEEKGFYHCFGCGAHGDVITFVMEKEGLSFPEAVERLAHDAGLQMPQWTPEEKEREKARAGLADVNEAAAKWFSDQLYSSRGKSALDYVKQRGLDPKTCQDFTLGFAPSGRTLLKQALLAKGFDEDLIIEAGLLIKPEDGGDSFDRFRNRLMFPIKDRRGRFIAFGGRAMDADAPAKYLNSPETPLFHKGTTLYNIDMAQKAAREKAQVIVGEGYMDVIAMAEGGYPNAVAPLGTALTEDQLRLLWRMAPEPLLCFDGDKAGVRAAMRAAERALPMLKPGYSLRFALLPEGEDPDTLIRSRGTRAFEDVLEHATPLAQLLWDHLASQADLSTPERRAVLVKEVMDMVRHIQNATVRRFYEEDMRARLDKIFGRGRGRKPQLNRENYQSRKGYGGWQKTRSMGGASSFLKASALARTMQGDALTEGLEKLILALCLNHPELLHSHYEELAALHFHNALVDKARAHLLSLSAVRENLESEEARNTLYEAGLSRLLDHLDRDAMVRRSNFAAKNADPARVEAGFAHILARLRRVVELEAERREAVAELERGGGEQAYQRLQAVTQELESASGLEIDFSI
jgi:DNA primase